MLEFGDLRNTRYTENHKLYVEQKLFGCMKKIALLSIVLCCSGLTADYVSPNDAGEYDEFLQCIVGVDGLCESDYVEEVFELCKDCEITTPEIVQVSDAEAFVRRHGIALLYFVLDHKQFFKCAGYTLALGAVLCALTKVCSR